jgi:hypothetical protein
MIPMTRHDEEIRPPAGAHAELPLDGESESAARRLRRSRPDLSRASEARIRRGVLTAATERWRPAHLRPLILAYALSGSLLLALAAMGLAGVGPLAF